MNEYHFSRVVILGAGGVGFWLATALSRDIKDVPIEVWDDDNFEGGNGARRLPFVRDKSQTKADFLWGFVQMVMNDSPPHIYPHKLTPDALMPDERWDRVLVMDCTDMDLEPRRFLWKFLTEKGATLMRVSYDGTGIVLVSPGLPFVGTPGGGYARVPTLGQSYAAAGLGAMAVMRALKTGYLSDYQVTIKDKGEEDIWTDSQPL